MVNGIESAHKIGKQNRQRPCVKNGTVKKTSTNSHSNYKFSENIDTSS